MTKYLLVFKRPILNYGLFRGVRRKIDILQTGVICDFGETPVLDYE